MDIETLETLDGMGTTIPSGVIARTGHWSTFLTDDERLTDMLAAEWFAAHVHWLPTDENGKARGARTLARTAVRYGRRIGDAWSEYAASLTAAHERENASAVILARLTATLESVNLTLPAPVSSDAIIAASLTPMAWHRWSQEREHLGSVILHAHGMPATRPDVWSRRHRSHVATADRVAFRGVARYELPTPCRYGKNGNQESEEVRADGVSEMLTTLREPIAPNIRQGWRGHRFITWQLADRNTGKASRKARKVERERVGAVSKRGKAVGSWAMATASLPRAVISSGKAERVSEVETMLRRYAIGASFDLGTIGREPVRVTIVDAASVATADGRNYGIREFARRVALAD